MDRTVFVTVGTTLFDSLVQAVDDPAVADALASRGYTRLLIQLGNGKHLPTALCPAGAERHTLRNGLQVEWFRFAPSLAQQMRDAALVISHAGSGSIFEALSLGKPLVVVPNEALMNNHQVELAEHLANMRHLIASSPSSLLETLRSMQLDSLLPYSKGDLVPMVRVIDQLMGF